MKISKIEIWNTRAAFRDGPYVMSHIVQEEVHGRILRVHADNGFYGLGEIPLSPYVLDEERLQRRTHDSRYFAGLIGQPVDALIEQAEQLRNNEGKWGSVACFGLETAFHDLTARTKGQSFTEQLGGRKSQSVNNYFSISESSVERISQRLTLAGPNRIAIQLKLGMGSLDDDIEKVSACLGVMNEHQLLQADANGGWTIGQALDVIGQFDDPRILWEEPCEEYDDNTEVARRSGRPVMVDQCTSIPGNAKRAVEENIASAICIKPPFFGGLRVAIATRDRCIAANMKMRIDGPWCGDIATAAILHLAVSAPPELVIAGCDLREPLVFKNDLGGAVSVEAGHVAPPSGIGLGFTVPDELLGEPVRVFI